MDAQGDVFCVNGAYAVQEILAGTSSAQTIAAFTPSTAPGWLVANPAGTTVYYASNVNGASYGLASLAVARGQITPYTPLGSFPTPQFIDPQGNLWGVTAGGVGVNGTIFELSNVGYVAPVNSVPEVASLGVMGLGALGLLVRWHKRV